MDLHKAANKVQTLEELIDFIKLLRMNFLEQKEQGIVSDQYQGRWENTSVDSFLGAMAEWAEDDDVSRSYPPLKHFAYMLLSGSRYE